MVEAVRVAIEQVRQEGNGARRTVPGVGGEGLQVSYLKGILRIDKTWMGVKIPLPARRGRGRASAPPTTN